MSDPLELEVQAIVAHPMFGTELWSPRRARSMVSCGATFSSLVIHLHVNSLWSGCPEKQCRRQIDTQQESFLGKASISMSYLHIQIA